MDSANGQEQLPLLDAELAAAGRVRLAQLDAERARIAAAVRSLDPNGPSVTVWPFYARITSAA